NSSSMFNSSYMEGANSKVSDFVVSPNMYSLDNGGRSYGISFPLSKSTIRPWYPSLRRVSAAYVPAKPPPMMIIGFSFDILFLPHSSLVSRDYNLIQTLPPDSLTS